MAAQAKGRTPAADAIADAIILANRALIQAAVRALGVASPEINLTAYRVLTLLDQGGARRLIDIAAALDVTPTTATRLADRLVECQLVERVRRSRDRREIHLEIAPAGRALVESVSEQRRSFVATVLEGFSTAEQAIAFRLLDRFADVTSTVARETA